MKIANAFRVGLVGTFGVLIALVIGSAIGSLSTVLTYILTALFLALGLEPIIIGLQRLRLPRWAALVVVVIVFLAVVTALVFAIGPLLVQQGAVLGNTAASFGKPSTQQQVVRQLQHVVGNGVDLSRISAQIGSYLQANAGRIGGGLLAVGVGILQGTTGTIIVIILTLYFAASLPGFKKAGYRLVPMTKREQFSGLTEQIFTSVGRYVVGQVSLALINGILSFIFLTLIGAQLPALFALIALVGSLIPLIGTVSAAAIIFVVQFALLSNHPSTWIAIAVYYAVYMQLEAYILSPRIMNRAVKVPGIVVVVAALAGGTLLGILGALIAIPVAAAILLIIEQVVVPRQAEA